MEFERKIAKFNSIPEIKIMRVTSSDRSKKITPQIKIATERSSKK